MVFITVIIPCQGNEIMWVCPFFDFFPGDCRRSYQNRGCIFLFSITRQTEAMHKKVGKIAQFVDNKSSRRFSHIRQKP